MADENQLIKGIRVGVDGTTYKIESAQDPDQDTKIANLMTQFNELNSTVIGLVEQIESLSNQITDIQNQLDSYNIPGTNDGSSD